MQDVSEVNYHVAEAMLITVVNLQTSLEQMARAAAENVQIQKLVVDAQSHTKNLELTLLEEMQILYESEVSKN